MKFSCRVHTW